MTARTRLGRSRAWGALLVALLLLWASPAWAAITQSHLTATLAGGVTSVTTASITPSVNQLVMLSVVHVGDSPLGSLTITTTTGLNFVLVDCKTSNPDNGGVRKAEVCAYRAMKPSGLSAGTVTATSGTLDDVIAVELSQFAGVDTSGTDGSGAVVQFADANGALGAATVTATLAAFGSSNNGTYMTSGFFDNSGFLAATSTATSGFTNIVDNAAASKYLQAAWWRADNSTTCATTVTDSYPNNQVGTVVTLEMKAASAGAGSPFSVTGPFSITGPVSSP